MTVSSYTLYHSLVLGSVLMLRVFCSVGDRMITYQDCMSACLAKPCKSDQTQSIWQSPRYNWLIWECKSECSYECMWKTVEEFQKNNVPIYQFHGKWPFVRLFGIQEPASAFFSILNALAHLYGLYIFRYSTIPKAPMYWVWHGYCMVAVHTWFWSTLFHTRDFDFTEKMDYFCATCLVTYQLFGLLARVLVSLHGVYTLAAGFLITLLLGYHIYHMGFVHFDYGYHMKVNIIIGAVNAIGWLLWCLIFREGRPFVWKCCTCILLAGAFLSLEVFDFPPFLYVLDAHALWHLGTAPLAVLWYSFAADDSMHMVKYGTTKHPRYTS